MAPQGRNIHETIRAVIKRRPVLEPVLKGLEPLLEAREKVSENLADILRDCGIRPPEFRGEQAAAGLPLLAGMSLKGMESAPGMAAETILPPLFEQEAIAPHREPLEKFFHLPTDSAAGPLVLLEALLKGDPGASARIAANNGLPEGVLNFSAEFVLSPLLRALAIQAEKYGGAPWDEEGAWNQGYCPVCGTFPSIAWLDRVQIDEKNAFLAGGGGKKHLHCPMCGAGWKFLRGVCPSCGKQGSGTMEILRETGSHGERIDWCAHCKTYCPTVDLRELAAIPDMDAMALGMIHLDMVAARKNLRPLRTSFWNVF